MTFNQIVILDKVTLIDKTIKKLKKYSKNNLIIYNTDPKNTNEIIKRISNSDCILLSWRTPITKEILTLCQNIKYIGLCGTNSNSIDLEECSKNNIIVSNVKDYGDEGVVEWIFFQLINLLRGFGKYQWRQNPSELCHKTIGIIGLGVIGKLIANTALGFKMKVLYYSRSRNHEFEKKGIIFIQKKELLQISDIITLQTPKNVKILHKNDFDIMDGKILVNNTLGKAFDKKDFIDWIKKENNFAIMDIVSDFKDEFKDLDRVIYSDFIAEKTNEFTIRLSQKILENIREYLSGKPINKIK